LETLKDFDSAVVSLVETLPAPQWDAGVYEGAWNARQLLCHIASTSGVAAFVLTLVQSSGGPPVGGVWRYPAGRTARCPSQAGVRRLYECDDAGDERRRRAGPAELVEFIRPPVVVVKGDA